MTPALALPDIEFLTDVCYINGPDGYLVWRRGTGDNVEITHIRSARPGGGPTMLKEMLEGLKSNPPYGGLGTVFGFTRTSNAAALRFYRNMGFILTLVAGVYAEGAAYLFSASYSDLRERHGIYD